MSVSYASPSLPATTTTWPSTRPDPSLQHDPHLVIPVQNSSVPVIIENNSITVNSRHIRNWERADQLYNSNQQNRFYERYIPQTLLEATLELDRR